MLEVPLPIITNQTNKKVNDANYILVMMLEMSIFGSLI